MMKNILFLMLMIVVFCKCSTNTFLSKSNSLYGKKIALAGIDITRQKRGVILPNDSVCLCISQTVAETLYPFFQKMGATVLHIQTGYKANESAFNKVADSLQVDYLLYGTGLINRVGNSDFMEQLSIKLVSTNTKEIILTGSFSGPSTHAAGAASRIGKKMVAKSKS